MGGGREYISTDEQISKIGHLKIGTWLEVLRNQLSPDTGSPLKIKRNSAIEIYSVNQSIEVYHSTNFNFEKDTDNFVLRKICFRRKPADDPFDLQWVIETPESVASKFQRRQCGGCRHDRLKGNFKTYYELDNDLIIIIEFLPEMHGINTVELTRLGPHRKGRAQERNDIPS